MRRHALCVSPIFVPAANAEAFVGAKMVMALVDAGHDVTVLTEPSAAGPDGPGDTSALWHVLRDRIRPVDAPRRPNVLATLWLGWRYRCWRIYPRWIHRALAVAAACHRERPFDLVYSRSLPMRAHMTGYWCARTLKLPWVANVNDPWDQHLFPSAPPGRSSMLKRVVSNYWLRKTLRQADVVTFPCRRLADYHARVSGVAREPDVVPHVGLALEAAPRDAGFHLVHAGALGPNALTTGRPSTGLLKGLARFLDATPDAAAHTTLTLVGPEDPSISADVAAMGLGHTVVCTGRRSFEDSLRHIAAADVCVLVEEDMPEGIYLPSKLADYVAADRHVLALSPKLGTVADLTPDTGLTRVDVHDDGAIARAIGALYTSASTGRLDARRPSQELRRMFSPEDVTTRFATALDAAMGTVPTRRDCPPSKGTPRDAAGIGKTP